MPRYPILVFVLLGLLFAACGGNDEDATPAQPTAEPPPAITGTPVPLAQSCASGLPTGLTASLVCIDEPRPNAPVGGVVTVRGYALNSPDGKVTVDIKDAAGNVLTTGIATIAAGEAGKPAPWQFGLRLPAPLAPGAGEVVAKVARPGGEAGFNTGTAVVALLEATPVPRPTSTATPKR